MIDWWDKLGLTDYKKKRRDQYAHYYIDFHNKLILRDDFEQIFADAEAKAMDYLEKYPGFASMDYLLKTNHCIKSTIRYYIQKRFKLIERKDYGSSQTHYKNYDNMEWARR